VKILNFGVENPTILMWYEKLADVRLFSISPMTTLGTFRERQLVFFCDAVILIVKSGECVHLRLAILILWNNSQVISGFLNIQKNRIILDRICKLPKKSTKIPKCLKISEDFLQKISKNLKFSKIIFENLQILEEIPKIEFIIRRLDFINQWNLYLKMYECSEAADFYYIKRMILLTVSTLNEFYCITWYQKWGHDRNFRS